MALGASTGAASPETLFVRFQRTGDPEALGALFDATAPALFRAALSLSWDAASAEDALQETYLAALEEVDRYDASRPVMPWLLGILRRQVGKARRREGRAVDPLRVEPRLAPADPADEAERRELEGKVRLMLDELPEPYRQVAILRWRYGLDPAEIAHARGEPPGTTRSLLHRALEKVRATLGGLPAFFFGPRVPRGLEAVRGEVVRRAPARVAAGAAVTTATAVAGGLLMAKKVLAVSVILLLAAGLWIALSSSQRNSERVPSAVPPREEIATGRPTTQAGPSKPASVESVAAEAAPAPDVAATPAREPVEDFGVLGRVVDADRRPVAGARVTLELSGIRIHEVTTDAGGRFAFPVLRATVSGPWVLNIVVTDGKGRAARQTPRGQVLVAPGASPADIVLPRLGLGDLVLGPAAPLEVAVTTGGRPAAGARVFAEEEASGLGRTEEVEADASGRARLEALTPGSWIVHARAAGLGCGRTAVETPVLDGTPVAVVLTVRTVEVEVVEAGTGKPAEGARLLVERRAGRSEDANWWWSFPSLDPLPTDSAGRTRIEGASADEALRLRVIRTGQMVLEKGLPPREVAPGETAVRLELPGPRVVRWRLVAGSRPIPPEGTEIVVDDGWPLRWWWDPAAPPPDRIRRGRVRGGVLVVEGLDPGEIRAGARAPDGSLARLHAVGGAAEGEPAVFHAPRTLQVIVKDEDGKPVVDSLVMIKALDGEPLNIMGEPDREGRTRFEGLPAEEVAVCPLAHNDYGGAEVVRADLREGDRSMEVVVGRETTVVVRTKVGGISRLPRSYSLSVVYPAPGGTRGEEMVEDPAEASDRGEIRFQARPHAPGKALMVELKVPGRDPIRREAHTARPGGEAVVEFDL